MSVKRKPILLTFDLETENHRHLKRLASPFYEKNYIVQVGWSINGGVRHEKYYTKHHRERVMPVETLDKMGQGDVIIGFNIKFDLLWVWKEPALQAALKRGVQVFCGQYAEYLLGGMTQEVQMCSMNDIAVKYGGGCKLDAVKELWDEGYLTSQIPRDMLTDYLVGDGKEIVGDIQNTWLIFVGQMKIMRTQRPSEFLTMFKNRMDGLLALCEMEFNGVAADKGTGETLREEVYQDMITSQKILDKFIPTLPPELEFKWSSSQKKSCLIFGGTVEYLKWIQHQDADGNLLYAQKKVEWPLFSGISVDPTQCIKAGPAYIMNVPASTDGAWEGKGRWWLTQDKFKGGKRAGQYKTKLETEQDLKKPKGKQQPHYFTFDGYTKPEAKWLGESTDAKGGPLYSVDKDTVEALSKRGIPFTNALSTFTKTSKDLGTYYWVEDAKGVKKGMLTLIDDKGIIHHMLNPVNTVTSRLSASNPNMQNVPRKGTSKIKQVFQSRFMNGSVAEVDYSQLEVVVQGVLTRDKQLMKDLNDKVDFHCKRLAKKLGEDYQYVWNKHHVEEDAQYSAWRTDAKTFSFQRAYGAGAQTIADDTGIPRSDIDALIEAEEVMYPGIKVFDQVLEQAIKSSRVPTSQKIFIGTAVFTQGEGHFDSPTGTRYIWREHETPKFLHRTGKYVGFSPTERKNYVVQGTGGEIVQTMLGKVFRYFLANDRFDGRVLLTNTVHDCLWLDGEKDILPKVTLEVQKILESVPAVFNASFPKLHVEVPFPCESEVGNNMFKMSVIHETK